MFLLSTRRVELFVQRDDDKCNSLRSTKNRYGHHCHPSLCLMVETRPTVLEDHLCVLLLVQGDLILRWIVGKLDLPDNLTVASALGNMKCSPFFGMRTSPRIESSSMNF